MHNPKNEQIENIDNRRRFLLRSGAGAAAFGVAATLGAERANALGKDQKKDAKPLVDPVTAYPTPPYPEQQQNWHRFMSC